VQTRRWGTAPYATPRPAGGPLAARPSIGRPRRPSPLSVTALALAAVVSLPLLTVLVSLSRPAEGLWAEAIALQLGRYVRNTVGLLLGVGAGVLVVGVGTAWLVTMCRFPGRRLCQHLLLLPLAIPAYLLAYTYADLLQFAGPVQTALRGWFGWERGDYWFPQIRSLGGAIVVLTFVLYPYVYLLARAAFLEQSVCVLEASRGLGAGPWGSFFRVALPLARPAILAGVALAAMEALADFGTVKHFEVATFATGIYQTWFGFGSPVGAAKLASGLLLFVLVALALERAARGGRRFHHTTARYRPLPGYRLRGARAGGALAACLVPPLVGFLVPAGTLLIMAVERGDDRFGRAFLRLAANSFGLAASAAVLAVAAAGVIAYGLRLAPGRATRLAARLATLGYAIPGVVVAVGVMLPFGRFDNAVDGWLRASFGVSSGLLLSGTVVALLFAYLVRFLALSFNAVESGLSRVKPSVEEAARSLGRGPGGVLTRVHVPLLRGSLLTGALLVFVDVLKELPATLILRPFNFETLAVRVYQLASDERLAEAATAALTIVAIGLLPVVLLGLAIERSRPGSGAGDRVGGP